MIEVHAKEFDGTWVGLAHAGKRIVATTVASTREGALRNLKSSVPPNVEHQVVENNSGFAEATMHMLRELEMGNEKNKTFALAEEYLPGPSSHVLKAAAAIPIGYVTSYGNIAEVAETGPRVVGQIMASNPLYPIVACHRVVGADFSLVGYGGRKSSGALAAKLDRLSKEAKGFPDKREVETDGKRLTVYPVEYVLRRAGKQYSNGSSQRSLFEE